MEFTKHKAVVSAIGTTLTALATAWASVELAVSDGGFDAGEIGSTATAVAAAIGTIYAVWRVPNRAVSATGTEYKLGQ
jgi:hypothetical protein